MSKHGRASHNARRRRQQNGARQATIEIRRATEAYLPAIRQTIEAAGVAEQVPSVENCWVALDLRTNCLAGCVRLELGDGVPYVRPVAVHPWYQGQGVGRRLMEMVFAQHDEIRVASRGSAVAFYRSLGFVEMDWDKVFPRFRTECDECPDRAICNPLPMTKVVVAKCETIE